MDQQGEASVSGRVPDEREEFLVDRHRGVCEPFFIYRKCVRQQREAVVLFLARE